MIYTIQEIENHMAFGGNLPHPPYIAIFVGLLIIGAAVAALVLTR